VVEHALREGLAGGCSAEVCDETEGLEHREVCVQVVDRGARAVVLSEDVAALLVEARVDATESLLWSSDVHKEHRLHEGRLCGQAARVHATTSGRHDLASTTVDSVGVHGDVAPLYNHSSKEAASQIG
jgi:hypothetical protein